MRTLNKVLPEGIKYIESARSSVATVENWDMLSGIMRYEIEKVYNTKSKTLKIDMNKFRKLYRYYKVKYR